MRLLQITNTHKAINKPFGISSAQVLRDLQKHFNPSKTFAPWLETERHNRSFESPNQYQKRTKRQKLPLQVKLGHGGTLDPAATGVLIVGVGTGTKRLQSFLECTKSYEAVVCFGVATDSYDGDGKVVKRAAYEHVTKDKVEEALEGFRGPIKQRPPLFSAIRVQGKHLYEYAREGKEVPVEILERSLTVDELSMTEFMEGGSHEYAWPTEEAAQADKELVEKTEHLDDKIGSNHATESATDERSVDAKRKRDEEVNPSEDVNGAVSDAPSKRSKTSDEHTMSGAIPNSESLTDPEPSKSKDETTETSTETKEAAQALEKTEPKLPAASESARPCPAPAARLHMTVSSGFYVRSLCHDLGTSVGSLAYMAALVRSRQSDFVLGKNVLEYEDLDKGEEVWGPKIVEMLAQWAERGEPVDRVPVMRPSKKASKRPRNTSSEE